MLESGSKKRVVPRRAVAVGTLSLVSALAVLLLLPLTSLGLRRPGVSLGGSTVTQVIRAVPQVTSAVGATVQHVLNPSSSGTVARPTAPGTAPATAVAAPQRAGSAVSAVTGTPATPAMYGTNPHGQGTVANVYLSPSTSLPYPYSPAGASKQGEILVAGRGRSEQQSDGTYDAHTTILALLGSELLGVDAAQGQSNTGPLNALQTGVLDQLCKALSQAVCLTVLAADTSATATGASTHFAIAQANIAGATGLSLGVASADSAISTTGSCQTSSGSSQVTDLHLAGGQVVGVGKSSESSTACTGQTPTQTASSSVISLAGTGVGIPAAGCANGAPNTQAGLLPPLISIICNADSTVQLATPAGVREALTVIALQLANSALLKTSAAASESHAVAPPKTTPVKTCTDSDHDCGNGPPLTSSSGAKCNGFPVDTVDHDGDCDAGYQKVGGKTKPNKCKDADHDCGIGPNGQREICVNGVDPDHDGDCAANKGAATCTDADHDCGIGANGEREICVNGVDPDHDGDCFNAGNGATGQVASGTLPFTGDNVLEVILVGLVLAAGGVALSGRTRRSRRHPKS
jgi:hypothetical protein